MSDSETPRMLRTTCIIWSWKCRGRHIWREGWHCLHSFAGIILPKEHRTFNTISPSIVRLQMLIHAGIRCIHFIRGLSSIHQPKGSHWIYDFISKHKTHHDFSLSKCCEGWIADASTITACIVCDKFTFQGTGRSQFDEPTAGPRYKLNFLTYQQQPRLSSTW